MLEYIRYAVVSASLLVLTACGGGSTSQKNSAQQVPSVSSIQTGQAETYIHLVLDELKISKKELSVSNGITSSPISENIDLNISKKEEAIIGVFNQSGQPILMGKKGAGESKVDISLESSAEIFVLYHPLFNGLEITDIKTLSDRIRSHKKFQDLVNLLKNEIESSNPCPMDPVCSPKVREIAIGIAEDLNLSDLH